MLIGCLVFLIFRFTSCYVFCFTTNRIRFVVNHPQDNIQLIGVRNLDTLQEEDIVKVAVRTYLCY